MIYFLFIENFAVEILMLGSQSYRPDIVWINLSFLSKEHGKLGFMVMSNRQQYFIHFSLQLFLKSENTYCKLVVKK